MTSRPASPYVAMLCGSFSFAIMATLTHSLSGSCAWPVIAAFRSGMALLIAASMGVFAGVQFVVWRPATLWLRSLTGSVSMVCTFWALTQPVPTADVLTLTNMFPIWIAVLSWPMLGQRPSAPVWLAVLSGFLGVVLMQQAQFDADNHRAILAMLVALLASLFTAFAMLGLHRLHNLDVRAIVAHFSSVALLFCGVAMAIVTWPATPNPTPMEPSSVAMLLGVGVTATIGQLLLTVAFSRGAPAKVSVIGVTQVVFAMLIELVLGHEQSFEPQRLLGIALVIVPTAWLLLRGR